MKRWHDNETSERKNESKSEHGNNNKTKQKSQKERSVKGDVCCKNFKVRKKIMLLVEVFGADHSDDSDWDSLNPESCEER